MSGANLVSKCKINELNCIELLLHQLNCPCYQVLFFADSGIVKTWSKVLHPFVDIHQIEVVKEVKCVICRLESSCTLITKVSVPFVGCMDQRRHKPASSCSMSSRAGLTCPSVAGSFPSYCQH